MRPLHVRLAALLILLGSACAAPDERCAVLVLVDGLRWQEVFGGAEEALIAKDAGGVEDTAGSALRAAYWRDTPAARRAALMPFLWSVVATRGQLLGDRAQGSTVRAMNGLKFSYPGYSEMIVGFADPRIDSNHKVPNPNVSVLEWLNGRPGFQGRVAAIGAWDVVPSIVNRERCGFPVFAAFEPIPCVKTPRMALLDELKRETPRPWDSMPYDAITVHAALEYVQVQKPRVLWLTLGETDEWGHARRYDEYLTAAHRTDQWLGELWSRLQAMSEYRGRTTLIVAADQGRGDGLRWTDHGQDVENAEFIWIAMVGPGVAPLGERTDLADATQGQIAATLAAALGEDYAAAQPRAAPPLPCASPLRMR